MTLGGCGSFYYPIIKDSFKCFLLALFNDCCANQGVKLFLTSRNPELRDQSSPEARGEATSTKKKSLKLIHEQFSCLNTRVSSKVGTSQNHTQSYPAFYIHFQFPSSRITQPRRPQGLRGGKSQDVLSNFSVSFSEQGLWSSQVWCAQIWTDSSPAFLPNSGKLSPQIPPH